MRTAVWIGGLAAAVAAAALVWLLLEGRGSGPADDPVDPASADASGLTPAEERAALLGPIEPVGYDRPANGLSVRSGPAGGAVFEMPGGREIAVAAPGGWALTGEFVLLNEVSAGFFLAREGADPAAEPALYFNFVDARRRLEPATSAAAEEIYGTAAEQIRAAGTLPFLDGEIAVSRTSADATAVYFCLTRPDGLGFRGGTRFVGPLSVTVMRVGACPEDMGQIADQLWLGEIALGANR